MGANVRQFGDMTRPPTGDRLEAEYEQMRCVLDETCERVKHVESEQERQAARLETVERNLLKRMMQVGAGLGAGIPIVQEIIPLVRDLVPLVRDLWQVVP